MNFLKICKYESNFVAINKYYLYKFKRKIIIFPTLIPSDRFFDGPD